MKPRSPQAAWAFVLEVCGTTRAAEIVLQNRHNPLISRGLKRGDSAAKCLILTETYWTANPRTPVRFRPWPPILSSGPRAFCTPFCKHVHDLVLSSLVMA